MQIQELEYALLPDNLEGTPREIRLGRRDLSRLLVVDRSLTKWTDSKVNELPSWLRAGDVLVLNNSKRIPGVLNGRTALGGKVEFRFVNIESDNDMEGLCRVFPMHDIVVGSVVTLSDNKQVRILEMGLTKYELVCVQVVHGTLRQLLKEQGTPILGFFYEGMWGVDELNPYYATEEGTVESPLAGLHFTPELVEAIRSIGVEVCFVTLHSVGSWLPFLEQEIEDHVMWEESFAIPEETAEAVNRARADGKRVFACGSTSLRALEDAATSDGKLRAITGNTNLYITPGYKFKVVDGYFTNFHQYQTSLIVLDIAFGGTELVMDSYREASKRHYSFYEFGDAVLYI